MARVDPHEGKMMTMSAGVHSIGLKIVHSLIDELRKTGWRVYELPLGANDMESFIRAAADAMPLDPPLFSMKNWDAFSDSLWGGLEQAGDPKVAIVWADASQFHHDNPVDYMVALEILTDLVFSLGDSNFTCGSPIQLVVLIDDNSPID